MSSKLYLKIFQKIILNATDLNEDLATGAVKGFRLQLEKNENKNWSDVEEAFVFLFGCEVKVGNDQKNKNCNFWLPNI